MRNSQDRQRWLIRFLVAVTMLATQGSPWSRAETPMVVDAASGLRLLVAEENTLPTLKILLPGEPISSSGIEVVFPEHVTVREHGKSEAQHLYLWRPGQHGDRPAWLRVGQSLQYEIDLKNGVHMLARAKLEGDGVRYYYNFVNHSQVDYDFLQAIWDPRLYQSIFRDVRLERTYVHRKEGVDLLASDMPARLTMPLNEWLPCRYLDSYTWPVPPAGKRVVKHGDITYYYASRPVDDPFVATVSQDGKWIAATFTRETGNVWTNPELTCQHADPETSLKARGTASLEGKTFVFMGTLEQFLEKIRKE
jgi:hypothetical protein